MEERKSRYELFLEEEARKAQPTKRCSRCGEVKALEEFHKATGERLGRRPRCKKCVNQHNRKYKDPVDRFWKYFHARTEKVDDCLMWRGGTHDDGQPVCQWEGRQTRVRRVVYKLSIGELPDDMYVITTCRNVACVRQSHLKKVTTDEQRALMWNSAATGERNSARLYPEKMSRKFCQPEYRLCGESHGAARLTENDVRTIRALHAAGGITQREIAERFGISQTHASQIIRRKNWAHVQ